MGIKGLRGSNFLKDMPTNKFGTAWKFLMVRHTKSFQTLIIYVITDGMRNQIQFGMKGQKENNKAEVAKLANAPVSRTGG